MDIQAIISLYRLGRDVEGGLGLPTTNCLDFLPVSAVEAYAPAISLRRPGDSGCTQKGSWYSSNQESPFRCTAASDTAFQVEPRDVSAAQPVFGAESQP